MPKLQENIKDHKIPIVATITIFILIVLTLIFKSNLSDITNIWQNIILLLTAWILVWYTNETYLLRKESRLQNKLSVLPVIKLQFCDPGKLESENSRVLLVINEGNGPALNVNIKSITFDDTEFTFPIIASIKREGYVQIFSEEILTEAEIDKYSTLKRVILDARNHDTVFTIKLTFQDIFGNTYEGCFPSSKISKDGFIIQLPQKEVTDA